MLPSLQLFALVLVGYAAGAELALALAEASGLAAVFFIPAGITVAALLRVPRKQWWVVLVAAGIAETSLDLLHGYSATQVAGFVAANVAEPVVGALVVGWACTRVDLARRRDVWWFVAGAGVLACAVGAAIGALADRLGNGDPFLATFGQWWLGDAVGVVLVGGAILAWGSSRDVRSIVSPPGAVLLGGSVLVTVGIFTLSDLPLMFLVLVGVVVAGAQFGPRAVTTTALAIGFTIAVVFSLDQTQLIAGLEDGTALVLIKLQLGVFTAAGLVVAAESSERERASRRASRMRERASAEHRIVEQLQHVLLPPESMGCEHFTATGIYEAASGDLGVGGDWYDAAALPDGRLLFSVGDVVGHGIHAASVMEQLTVALSVLAPEARTAGALIERLDAYAERIPGALCTTAWTGIYDPTTGILSYAAAGHPPGFMLGGDGTVTRLEEGRSVPLGVARQGARPSASVHIVAPVTLVMFTDGLVERRGETIDDGLSRLEDVLRRAAVNPRWGPRDVLERVAARTRHDDTVLLWVDLDPVASVHPQRRGPRRLLRRR